MNVIAARILRQCACDLAKGEAMKRAQCILYGATALLLGAGATAQTLPDENSATNAAAVYSVDEDRDGRADRELLLEQSDSLA
jgi:hypothetical protein